MAAPAKVAALHLILQITALLSAVVQIPEEVVGGRVGRHRWAAGRCIGGRVIRGIRIVKGTLGGLPGGQVPVGGSRCWKFRTSFSYCSCCFSCCCSCSLSCCCFYCLSCSCFFSSCCCSCCCCRCRFSTCGKILWKLWRYILAQSPFAERQTQPKEAEESQLKVARGIHFVAVCKLK